MAKGSDLSVDSGFSANNYPACLAPLHLSMCQGGRECEGCICVQKKLDCQILFTLLKNLLPSSIRWQTASLSRPELNQW